MMPLIIVTALVGFVGILVFLPASWLEFVRFMLAAPFHAMAFACLAIAHWIDPWDPE